MAAKGKNVKKDKSSLNHTLLPFSQFLILEKYGI